MDRQIILTSQGLERFERELDHLRTVNRKEVADRIRDSKQFGEFTENSEYEDAKMQQAFVEGRILELENILTNALPLEDLPPGLDELRRQQPLERAAEPQIEAAGEPGGERVGVGQALRAGDQHVVIADVRRPDHGAVRPRSRVRLWARIDHDAARRGAVDPGRLRGRTRWWLPRLDLR